MSTTRLTETDRLRVDALIRSHDTPSELRRMAHIIRDLSRELVAAAEREQVAKAEAWREGWNAAGDAYFEGLSAFYSGEPCPVSDGPPNPYRAEVGAR